MRDQAAQLKPEVQALADDKRVLLVSELKGSGVVPPPCCLCLPTFTTTTSLHPFLTLPRAPHLECTASSDFLSAAAATGPDPDCCQPRPGP
jgi:hypothetical protein